MDFAQKFQPIRYSGVLPVALQVLVSTIDTEAIGYPKRQQDVGLLENYFAAGNHTLATHQANLMAQRQKQFLNVQEHGVPTWMQSKIKEMTAAAFDYKGRTRDIGMLDDYIRAGDITLANLMLDQIVERQSNLRTRMTTID